MLTFKEPGSGATWLARRMARRRNGLFRAPHHTASDIGAQGELAIAAGGTLYLDEALKFRRNTLAQLLSTWRMMPEAVRPDLVLGCLLPDGDGGAQRRFNDLLERLPVEPRGFHLERLVNRGTNEVRAEVAPWR